MRDTPKNELLLNLYCLRSNDDEVLYKRLANMKNVGSERISQIQFDFMKKCRNDTNTEQYRFTESVINDDGFEETYTCHEIDGQIQIRNYLPPYAPDFENNEEKTIVTYWIDNSIMIIYFNNVTNTFTRGYIRTNDDNTYYNGHSDWDSVVKDGKPDFLELFENHPSIIQEIYDELGQKFIDYIKNNY